MKWTALAATAVLTSGLLAADPGTPKVEWEGKLYPAFQKACKEKKLLVVYFRNDYCASCKGPCRHCAPIDAIVQGKEVGALASRAVWVWQNTDKDDEQGNVARLMKDLKVERVPCVVVLEVSATRLQEKGRIMGAVSADAFLSQLRDYLGMLTPQ